MTLSFCISLFAAAFAECKLYFKCGIRLPPHLKKSFLIFATMSSFLLVYSPNLSGLTSIRLGTNVFNNKLIHAQDELKKLDLWEHGNLFVNNSLYHFSPAQASVINLLADYARQHGNYAQTLPAKTQKYVRGIYSCPHQAGNRLTHFLNAFAFAVVTNRTLLWEYCSDSHHFCPMHGSIRDCEKVLHRAPWIQSYEEIIGASDKPLGNDIEPSPYNALSGTNSLLDQIKERREVLFDQQPEKVLDFGVLEFQTAALAEANQSLSAGALSVANQLFAAGMSFAYGALFHMVFRFHQRVMPSQIYMTKHIQFVKSGGLTVAIHSRHTDQVDDGSRIEGERQCIAQVISSRGNCSINIMSDRSETIKRLVNFSTIEYGCDSIVAEHQMGSSLLQEHGAYAGVGLFQDLAMAQHTSHAVIITPPSSVSSLLTSLVTFKRAEMLDVGKFPPLVICMVWRGADTCQCQTSID